MSDTDYTKKFADLICLAVYKGAEVSFKVERDLAALSVRVVMYSIDSRAFSKRMLVNSIDLSSSKDPYFHLHYALLHSLEEVENSVMSYTNRDKEERDENSTGI